MFEVEIKQSINIVDNEINNILVVHKAPGREQFKVRQDLECGRSEGSSFKDTLWVSYWQHNIWGDNWGKFKELVVWLSGEGIVEAEECVSEKIIKHGMFEEK